MSNGWTALASPITNPWLKRPRWELLEDGGFLLGEDGLAFSLLPGPLVQAVLPPPPSPPPPPAPDPDLELENGGFVALSDGSGLILCEGHAPQALSGMDSADTPQSTDILSIVRAGSDRQFTLADLISYLES